MRTSRALSRKDERRRAGAPTRSSRLKPVSMETLVMMRVTGITTWTTSLYLMMLNFNHSFIHCNLASVTYLMYITLMFSLSSFVTFD